MERTLILLKPSAVLRAIMGEVITRFERKGLRIVGLKMLQLDDKILEQHYAHLVDKPFFPTIQASMKASPVVAICVEGVEAISVVRTLCGPTNSRQALPGTIRGDFSCSFQENIVHASDGPDTAASEIARFFSPCELFDYKALGAAALYSPDELK